LSKNAYICIIKNIIGMSLTKTETIFACRECGCKDGYIIPSHPTIIECIKCGHPNDLSWDIEYPEDL
jgi:hypothetical protein